jgi:hypothetical protein
VLDALRAANDLRLHREGGLKFDKETSAPLIVGLSDEVEFRPTTNWQRIRETRGNIAARRVLRAPI